MLILTAEEIRRSITLPQVMEQVEAAYRLFEQGKYTMPERMSVVEGADTLVYMPCFAEGFLGTKMLTLFPGNPERGLPYINGLYLLHERKSGALLALLDGSLLTALRTGAVGGVGMRLFAAPEAHTLGIVGCGTQGFYQAVYACVVRDIHNIYLFDSADKDFSHYIEDLQKAIAQPGLQITVCGTVEELLQQSEIVVTTTTATAPVLPNDATRLKGKCFIAIGSYKPQMRELPDAIWQVVEQVHTELPYALEESGDLAQPLAAGLLTEQRVRYIGQLLQHGGIAPQPTPDTSTYFKSVGMGLLDLQVAGMIYQQACKLGIGVEMEL